MLAIEEKFKALADAISKLIKDEYFIKLSDENKKIMNEVVFELLRHADNKNYELDGLFLKFKEKLKMTKNEFDEFEQCLKKHLKEIKNLLFELSENGVRFELKSVKGELVLTAVSGAITLGNIVLGCFFGPLVLIALPIPITCLGFSLKSFREQVKKNNEVKKQLFGDIGNISANGGDSETQNNDLGGSETQNNDLGGNILANGGDSETQNKGLEIIKVGEVEINVSKVPKTPLAPAAPILPKVIQIVPIVPTKPNSKKIDQANKSKEEEVINIKENMKTKLPEWVTEKQKKEFGSLTSMAERIDYLLRITSQHNKEESEKAITESKMMTSRGKVLENKGEAPSDAPEEIKKKWNGMSFQERMEIVSKYSTKITTPDPNRVPMPKDISKEDRKKWNSMSWLERAEMWCKYAFHGPRPYIPMPEDISKEDKEKWNSMSWSQKAEIWCDSCESVPHVPMPGNVSEKDKNNWDNMSLIEKAVAWCKYDSQGAKPYIPMPDNISEKDKNNWDSMSLVERAEVWYKKNNDITK